MIAHYVDGMVSGKHVVGVTAKLRLNAVFYTDEEYGYVLSGTVVACVDAALLFEGKLLIGRRLNEPLKGGWSFPGGRMKIGESFGETASRHVRALGLQLSPERFRVVRSDSYAWSKRSQPPEDAGCHMQGTILFAEISREEREQIKSKDDHAETRWLSFEEAIRFKELQMPDRVAAQMIRDGQFQVEIVLDD